MDETNIATVAYQVPTYELDAAESWFHFLHGNVPGHQIDFMYRPVVPQTPLTRQHFAHLSRILKYIEPRPGTAFAFAITNLSRDDTQYEPGHGGVAFVFGLRIKGARDHAGRQDPPFCHSAVLVDRHLDAQAIYGIAMQFYQKLLPDQESRVEGSGWYHTYVQHAQVPERSEVVIKGYLGDFSDLYVPPPSRLSLRWTVEDQAVPRRVVIVYPDDPDMTTLLYCMARIAAVLVESDIKWSAISNGREQDLAGGLTVRFVPRRDAMSEPDDVVLMYLEQVPEEPEEIAAQLFNAQPARRSQLPDLRVNFPFAQQHATKTNGVSKSHDVAHHEPAHDGERARREVAIEVEVDAAPEVKEDAGAAQVQGLDLSVVERAELDDPMLPQRDLAAELRKTQRRNQWTSLVAIALFVVTIAIGAAIWAWNEKTRAELLEPAAGNSAAPTNTASAVPAASTALPAMPAASGTATGSAPAATARPNAPVLKGGAKPLPTSNKKSKTKKPNPWNE